MTGYDGSKQMAEYAAGRLSHLGNQARVVHGDLRDFKIPRKFDIAISMNAVFQYLMRCEDVAAHLRCVSDALTAKGLYLISLPTPQDFFVHPPDSIVSRWSGSKNDITVAVDWTYRQKSIDRSNQTFAGLARFIVTYAAEKHLLWMPYKYRMFFSQEIYALIALSGCFDIGEIYGAFDVNKHYTRMRKPKVMNVLLQKKRWDKL